MSNDTNINTLSTADDKSSRDFTRVLWATKAVEDCDHLAQEPDRMRWSITYGGDCSLDLPMYRDMIAALLGAVSRDVMSLVLTVQHAGTGENHSFNVLCPEGGIKVQGGGWNATDSEPYIMVSEYYPDTDSAALTPVKVYLHQILNIHIP